MTAGRCPVDGKSLPTKTTGRPATYCSTTCRKRADQRRRMAAKLRNFADDLERAGVRYAPSVSARSRRELALKRRIDGLRADANKLLDLIGEGPPC